MVVLKQLLFGVVAFIVLVYPTLSYAAVTLGLYLVQSVMNNV